MAVYTGVQVHILKGIVTSSQDHSMAGTFASQSSAILVGLDFTNNPPISANVTADIDHSTKYTFTVITAK